MKRIVLLFIPLLFSLVSVGQQITLSANATMSAPSTMKKLSSVEDSSIAANKFSKTKYLARNFANYPNSIYRIDNVLIMIIANSAKNSANYLQLLKTALDDTGHLLPDYSSKIETIGNTSVLVLNEVFEGFKMYRFFGVNSAGDGRILGYVQYNAGDETNAKTILENVIRSVKFKIP